MDDLDRIDDEILDLQNQVESLEDRREQLRHKLALLATVRGNAVRGNLVTVGAVVVMLGVSAGVFVVLAGDTGGAETMYGEVTEVSGKAPVEAGTSCTVFYQDANSDNYDGRLDVLCGRRLVYGGSGLGWLDCDYAGGLPTRCADPDFTPEGGDPKLVFDRQASALVIEDIGPEWALRIDLTTPPAGR